MTFDVVITTYNRSDHVVKLCSELAKCTINPNKLIVIDSSDEPNKFLESKVNLEYKRTSHKSQPYQRYIGYLVSDADIIIFLDDDLSILDPSLFETVLTNFMNNEKLVGLGLGIDYHNSINKNLYNSKFSFARRLISNVRKKIPAGEVTRFGQTSELSKVDFYTKFLPGPNMCFKRNSLNGVFDDQLFSLFEKKIGMGEDKVISMRVSKKGEMIYLGSSIFLSHPPISSTYFTNEVEFRAKVLYSRIWIAHQYNKIWPSKLNNIYIVVFLLKHLLMSIPNNVRLKAYFLSISYIRKYGFFQSNLGFENSRYSIDSINDAK
jgi:glycosyltransferase involved in cell wall biosynthesis